MYSIMRRIHAFSGIMLLLFTVMFFLTGLLILWFESFPVETPTPTTSVIAVQLQGPGDAGSVIGYFRDSLGLRGRASARTQDDGTWRVEFVSPGRNTRITLSESHEQATVISAPKNWKVKWVGLHRLTGYGGGLVFALWALLYDIVSLSMIAFPLTGIYLWYRRTPDRRLGWVLLSGSVVLMVSVTVKLMLAP